MPLSAVKSEGLDTAFRILIARWLLTVSIVDAPLWPVLLSYCSSARWTNWCVCVACWTGWAFWMNCPNDWKWWSLTGTGCAEIILFLYWVKCIWTALRNVLDVNHPNFFSFSPISLSREYFKRFFLFCTGTTKKQFSCTTRRLWCSRAISTYSASRKSRLNIVDVFHLLSFSFITLLWKSDVNCMVSNISP